MACKFSAGGKCALTGVECDGGQDATADCPLWGIYDEIHEVATALWELFKLYKKKLEVEELRSEVRGRWL